MNTPHFRETLAARIEHTDLKPAGTPASLEQLCDEARRYGFAVVMVHPSQIEFCGERLLGSAVRLGTVVGFPLGQNTSAVKAFEIQDALARGAQDVDMVINLRALQADDDDFVRREMTDLAVQCAAANAVSKVILETALLTDAEKQRACRLALEAGVDYVKTSTGFAAGGATTDDIRLMRATVGDRCGVKASGGIRTLDAALAMLEAGADRLGTSSGVAILDELAVLSRNG